VVVPMTPPPRTITCMANPLKIHGSEVDWQNLGVHKQ